MLPTQVAHDCAQGEQFPAVGSGKKLGRHSHSPGWVTDKIASVLHPVHWVAAGPEQVKHDVSQGWQLCGSPANPIAGHEQTPPARTELGKQLRQVLEAADEHVRQDGSHAWQSPPAIGKKPGLQVQRAPLAFASLHTVHSVGLEHSVHCIGQLEQTNTEAK